MQTETSPQQESALLVNGMDCASCVAHVRKAAETIGGVQACDVNLARGRAVVRYDASRTTPEEIAAAITDAGYPSAPEQPHDNAANVEEQRLHHQMHEARAWFRRALVGFLLWFPVEATHWFLTFFSAHHQAHGSAEGSAAQPDWMTWTALITSTISIVYVGAGFYRSAFKAARRLTSNMDTLIAMGATVAYGYSLIALIGYLRHWWIALPTLYFMEAAGLLALISLGHWLEARARQSAGSAIRELLQLAPQTARKVESGEWGAESNSSLPPTSNSPLLTSAATSEVPVADLHIGDLVLVRPGDRVAIDGQVVKGRSSVDESLITGESLPVSRDVGDKVIGGTQNIDGALIVRVTSTGAQTALAQIIKLVEHAQASKPAIQQLADQVAAVFVPAVLSIALVTGIGWYFAGWVQHWDSAYTWGKIALAVCSVLIIACPCALGLAVPAALMVGTGRGAKKGILIRDIDALQRAERIDTVVLDKTGTITQGKPVVTQVQPLNGMLEDEVLRLAASAEQYSEHPIARAIVAAAESRGIHAGDPQSFSNEPGYGVTATIDGLSVLVGNEAMLRRRDTGFQPVSADPVNDGPRSSDASSHGLKARVTSDTTLVHVAIQREQSVERVGTIAISDQIKSDSQGAIDALHRLGLRTVLLTGDNRATAEAIARQVKIDDVRAEVKPDGKADTIRELQDRKSHFANHNSAIAMVGDGINDAPALAQADLGIAIGTGSDIAKQTSDIVLVGGSLHGIATALRLSRATMRTIRQNLFFAFIYNVLAIPLAAFGLLNPYIAAAAMALSDVTVLGNALLLRRAKID